MFQSKINQTFKQRVIEITKNIPSSQVATYAQVALLAGSPKASRAVGMIMSKNDSPKTMPCHRVVSSNGKLTGYAFGGIERKKEILKKEGVIFKSEETIDLKKSKWQPE